jgi:tetratricopeptide (TPR) repeat protein
VRRISFIALFVGSAALAFAEAVPAAEAWRELVYAAGGMVLEGRLTEAEQSLVSALRLARSFSPSDSSLAISLNNLGSIYQERGRYHEAERLYRESLRAWTAVAEQDGGERSWALNNLATLCMTLRRHKEAVPLLDEALRLRTKSLGSRDVQMTTIWNNLGLVNHALRNFPAAERAYQAALDIYGDYEKQKGLVHPQSASILNNLGLLRSAQGRADESRALMAQAIVLLETAFGPRHPALPKVRLSLAEAEFRSGRAKEAEEQFTKALDTALAVFGDDHPLVADILSSYAMVLQRTSRKKEAKQLDARAKAILASHAEAAFAQYTISFSDMKRQYSRKKHSGGRIDAEENARH